MTVRGAPLGAAVGGICAGVAAGRGLQIEFLPITSDLVFRHGHREEDLGIGVAGAEVLDDVLDSALGGDDLHSRRSGSGRHLAHEQAHSSGPNAID